jgi:hypothetical protein
MDGQPTAPMKDTAVKSFEHTLAQGEAFVDNIDHSERRAFHDGFGDRISWHVEVINGISMFIVRKRRLISRDEQWLKCGRGRCDEEESHKASSGQQNILVQRIALLNIVINKWRRKANDVSGKSFLGHVSIEAGSSLIDLC